MYPTFTLVLMVNHACNLRCSYCYTGAKFSRAMPVRVAWAAVDRALASLRPQGRLDLGFFGGEPLLEAALVSSTVSYAEDRTAERGLRLACSLTTNGSCADPAAWAVMTHPLVDLSVSHDGLPAVHDRHRVARDGGATSAAVERTLRRLVDAGRDFNVVMVVRPETAARLPEGIAYLRDLGVRRIEPSLDLWTPWPPEAIGALESSISRCAEVWRDGLPGFALNWFDEALARLAGVPVDADARCGFGVGQIAVAPSGRLYPCERLIGEDQPGHPMSLPGTALEGDDFHSTSPVRPCGGSCPCSNYVRTGHPERPDELIRALDRACLRETARVVGQPLQGGFFR